MGESLIMKSDNKAYNQAHIAQDYFKEVGYKIKLAHIYEMLSKIYGHANWDTYSAFLNSNCKNEILNCYNEDLK